MIDLQKNIVELNNYLFSVLDNLKELQTDNFNDKLKNINCLIKKIEDKRIFLKKNFHLDDLRANCDVANTTIKHIYSKVDSMIEIRKEQQKIIRNDLSEIINKKKLINYQR